MAGYCGLPTNILQRCVNVGLHACTTECAGLIGTCPVADSCPVLCSGNGVYEKGRCVCLAGWKGAECNVEEGQCIDPTCSNHGSCIQGICICSPAYKGINCEQGKMFYNVEKSRTLCNPPPGFLATRLLKPSFCRTPTVLWSPLVISRNQKSSEIGLKGFIISV